MTKTQNNTEMWISPMKFEEDTWIALSEISYLYKTLLVTTHDFEFQEVAHEQIEMYQQQLAKATSKRNYEATLTKLCSAQIYKNSALINYLDAFIQSRKLAAINLLQAAKTGLEAGNILVSMICFRSLIEHVAYFHHAIKTLENEFKAVGAIELYEARSQMLATIKRLLLSTRFDWHGIDSKTKTEITNQLKGKQYEYKHSGESTKVDLKARQILACIDLLGKELPNIRGIYELLCEFAHPNMGVLYSTTTGSISGVDKQGIYWHSKTMGQDPPEIPTCLQTAFSSIFCETAMSLKVFEDNLARLDEHRADLLNLAQRCVLNELKTLPIKIDIYAECPCGSGSKSKFCCLTNRKT